MNENMIKDLKNVLGENKIILGFTGAFSQGVIEEIGEALKNYMYIQKKEKTKTYKVFSSFIEQTQNIKNYISFVDSNNEKSEILFSSLVFIGEEEKDKYFICSGNYVKKEDKEYLEGVLKELIKVDQNELKDMYRKILRNSLKTSSNGAGLGLIEIARISNQQIKYEFINKENEYFYFLLTVYI